jgi:hypothetical protein
MGFFSQLTGKDWETILHEWRGLSIGRGKRGFQGSASVRKNFLEELARI